MSYLLARNNLHDSSIRPWLILQLVDHLLGVLVLVNAANIVSRVLQLPRAISLTLDYNLIVAFKILLRLRMMSD